MFPFRICHSCSTLFLSLTHIISTNLLIDCRISLISSCWATTISCKSLTISGSLAYSLSFSILSFSRRISLNILYSWMLENGKEPRSFKVYVKSRLNYILLIKWVSKLLPRSAVVYHRSKSRLSSYPEFFSSSIFAWLGPSGLSGSTPGAIRIKVS